LLPAWALAFYTNLRDELRLAQPEPAVPAAALAQPTPAPDPDRPLDRLTLDLLERPEQVSRPDLALIEPALRADTPAPATARAAAGALAGAVGSRPDLVERSAAASLAPLFQARWLSPDLAALAGQVLTALLGTAAADGAIALALELLTQERFAAGAREPL